MGDPEPSSTLTCVLACARVFGRCAITLPFAAIDSEAAYRGNRDAVVCMANDGAADE
jgi:hypothetical protein